MSKSAILKSSIAKKYWMALTGLFLCTFLVGHLLGNLQLLENESEEAKRAFNEYAYFMGHNIFIKILSWITMISIIFHSVDGFLLTFQNKKARPQKYAMERPGTNSALPSRYMAILGTAILVFIVIHMANFWYHAKWKKDLPLHTITKEITKVIPNQQGQPEPYPIKTSYYLTTSGKYLEYQYYFEPQNLYVILDNDRVVGVTPKESESQIYKIKNKTELYDIKTNLKVGEGYKDLYTLTVDFFSKDTETGLIATILYVLAMCVLAFHLWHGFASAFQTLGVRHPKYSPIINGLGKGFAILIPLGFAIIPIILYTR